jgi:protein-S-isoprenylcysteine O-methyltransferase Ste14
MALAEDFERSGNWLFRWRGYLPLLALALLVIHLRHYHYLLGNAALDDAWELACFVIAALGLALRAHVVGHTPRNTSGRNAREQRADSLNTSGLYSLVRHPLYLGNFLIFLGTVGFVHDPWPATVCLLGFWLYYERIMFAEEAFLRARFGDAYLEWAARTPAIVPSLRHWRAPALPFSLRNVLRREYNNVFSVIVAMFLLDTISDSVAEGRVDFGRAWLLALAIGFVAWIVLRTLKRRTQWLRVEGR